MGKTHHWEAQIVNVEKLKHLQTSLFPLSAQYENNVPSHELSKWCRHICLEMWNHGSGIWSLANVEVTGIQQLWEQDTCVQMDSYLPDSLLSNACSCPVSTYGGKKPSQFLKYYQCVSSLVDNSTFIFVIFKEIIKADCAFQWEALLLNQHIISFPWNLILHVRQMSYWRHCTASFNMNS